MRHVGHKPIQIPAISEELVYLCTLNTISLCSQTMKSVQGFRANAHRYRDTASRSSQETLHSLSLEHINANRFEEAKEILRQLVDSKTSLPSPYNNLAILYQLNGRYKDSIPLLKKAISLAPEDAETHFNLGVSLQHQEQNEAAIVAYSKALKLRSNHIDSLNNLGNIFLEEGRSHDASHCYEMAIKHQPDNADAYNNLGNALRSLNRNKEAVDIYQQAIMLHPEHAKAYNNLGNSLRQLGQINQAIACYSKAIAIQPDYAEAHTNLGMALLSLGDYRKGLKEFEWRSSHIDAIHPHAIPACLAWQGKSIPSGESLLLISEQGLGDSLQFMRYASNLRQQGIQVRLCIQEKLHGLAKASGLDETPLSPEQGSAIANGHWISLMSLPNRLNITPHQPLTTSPYLKTTSELQQRWQQKLKKESGPVIGINWQGNPIAEKISLLGRSLPLNAFKSIAESWPGKLLSLQKGTGSDQLRTCSFRSSFVSCQRKVSETWDFLETAAMIQACELVITSDTAVAHLSAGLGQTTWLLLNKTPDWRWGLSGENTFWYPSMRLFRQTSPGDWNQVIQDVRDALQQTYR